MDSPAEPQNVLAYASAVESVRLRPLLVVAKVLAVLPLVAGITCLLGYGLSRHIAFVAGGVWTIVLGTVAMLVGLTCVIIFRLTNRPKERELRKEVNRYARNTTLLLLLNIPVAIICTMLGVWMMERFKQL